LKLDDVPPVPALPTLPVIQTQRSEKPLHTPSDSGSSDDSVANSDTRSATSSRSSPPGSDAWGLSRRPSKASAFESPVQGEHRIARVASPEPLQQSPRPITPETRAESRNGTTGYNRGMAPEPLLKPRPNFFPEGPESPMDPAIQLGLLNQRRPSKPSVLPAPPPPPPPPPAFNFSMSPPKDASPVLAPPAPTPVVKRRGTTANKGRCRGCSEQIVGRSVKAADGRLTGRYHKQCMFPPICLSSIPLV
jgi:hypothetical protein